MLLTRKQLAEKYPAVTETQIKLWTVSGKLPFYRPGGRVVLVEENDFVKMIESTKGATV